MARIVELQPYSHHPWHFLILEVDTRVDESLLEQNVGEAANEKKNEK